MYPPSRPNDGKRHRYSCLLCHSHGLEGLGQRSNLVHLDQDGVRNPLPDAAGQSFRIGHEQIIPNELDLIPQGVSEELPSLPVIFRHPIFDRDNRILPNPIRPEFDHLLRLPLTLIRFLEDVLPLARIEEFARRRVEGQTDIYPGPIPCLCNGFENGFRSFVVRFEIRSKSSLVPDRC